MGAVDNVRRALTEAYGDGLILGGMTVDDLIGDLVEEVRRETSEADRPRDRIRTDHRDVAAGLRSQPGVWGSVGEYSGRASADSIARLIRTAQGTSGDAYAPAGSFEARLKASRYLVEARYVEKPDS